MNVRQNIVPSSSPRKAILQKGVLFRFGYEPLQGTDMSKVGEVVFLTVPDVEVLRELQQNYCREHNIDEPFVPSEYGY